MSYRLKAISKRFEVKPNCIRSVHVTGDRGRWVAKINGNYHCISGNVVEDRFVPDSKFRELMEIYEPKRVSRKKSDKKIMSYIQKDETGSCVYKGEIRRITFNRNDYLKGTIYWKGSRIKVEYNRGEWVKVE